MRCLICHVETIPAVTWATFWKPPVQKKICQECEEQMDKITAPFCPACYRPGHEGVCQDCQKWEKTNPDLLERNIAVFPYNEFNKDLVARWKYRGDYALLEAYKEHLQNVWLASGFKGKQILSVPLSSKRLHERGFNQSEAIIKSVEEDHISIFERSHSEKQSKRGRRDRMQSENPFRLLHPVTAPVVIVDDIYTTGRTVRHMASLLKKQGCPSISSFTIFR
ncbi:ComF family protein [Halobacillus trueperi]|uniref:ComF family protein n=2 Tax=Halobacillus trueperi TaxID=156205 RepID=A0A3D8VPZ1_9BACI|nr:ComF family protein [Halobacillus trueperi]